MKILLAVLLLSCACFAQHDFTAQGGVIAKAGPKLIAPNSGLLACSDTINVNTNVTGSFSLVTPSLTSGTFQAGGTFGAGGSVTLTVSGQYCENFTGAIDAGATWRLITLANGDHQYTLTAILAGGKGAFVLQTIDIGKGFFNSAEGVFQVDIHLNQ